MKRASLLRQTIGSSRSRTSELFDPNLSQDQYYPAQRGNEWRYHCLSSLRDEKTGGATTTSSMETETLVDLIPTEGGRGSIMTLRHDNVTDGYREEFETIYRMTPESLAAIDSESIYLSFPLRVGVAWEWTDSMGKSHSAIIETIEEVNVRGGVFRYCLKIVENIHDHNQEFLTRKVDWYAPQVGRVRSTVEHVIPNMGSFEEVRELISYRLS